MEKLNKTPRLYDEYITFESLQESIGIPDPSLFTEYLKEVYKDLVGRSTSSNNSTSHNQSKNQRGMSKSTFYDYIKLPVFISEKLFSSLDNDNDGYIDSTEFVQGLKDLYTGSFDRTIEIVFNLLDFDKDGQITKEDIKILLSYLPLKEENQIVQYKFQMDSLNEINEIINQTFKGKSQLMLSDFKTSIKKVKSDIFLQIICFLYLQKPFNNEAINSFQFCRKRCYSMKSKNPLSIFKFLNSNKGKDNNNNSNNNINNSNNKNNNKYNSSDKYENTMLKSPDPNSNLSPLLSYLKATNVTSNVNDFNLEGGNDKIVFDTKDSSPIISAKGMTRFYNEKIFNKDMQFGNLEANIKNSKNVFESPSVFLLDKDKSKVKVVGSIKDKDGKVFEQVRIGDRVVSFEKLNLDISENEDDEDDDDDDDEEEEDEDDINNEKNNKKKDNNKKDINNNKNININDKNDNNIDNNKVNNNNEENKGDTIVERFKSSKDLNKIIIYQNWVYKISMTNPNSIKKYYLCVINKDVFYYKNEKKEELVGMHNLTGCFVKDFGEININQVKYFKFQIFYDDKIKDYYTTDKEICTKFVETIKAAIGYLNFFDYYEMIGNLGEGKFGKVKLGIHKRTNKEVAIKIIKKSEMTAQDGELIKSEIDIMKLCHHPNIIHLLDHFENSEYIFIVMEYLSGGDLDSYLRKQKSLFTEEKAANIIYQICSGIQYLHKYGILHRDLKPENIMLSDNSENSVIKIMDFGLSKIIGPYEKASEGFGTLNFVAPEVLLRTPYNKSVDIWSIGIIMYYILCGRLPFDDPTDNEEKIAKSTVFKEPEFSEKVWCERSPEVINLIKLCLVKDPAKRIKIDDILKNKWLTKFLQNNNKNTNDDNNNK